MAERFNGRIGRDVLIITVGTQRSLVRLLQGSNVAYNARRQRALKGKAPNDIITARLRRKPKLAIHTTDRPTIPAAYPKRWWWSNAPRRGRIRTTRMIHWRPPALAGGGFIL